VGRGREVILEGGQRPREERPSGDVKTAKLVNASVCSESRARRLFGRLACQASRISRPLVWLKSSEPRRRKARNGMEDNAVREDSVAMDGEKPLKVRVPKDDPV
jgi:hypothetical protein